jgi:hypothetical protein
LPPKEGEEGEEERRKERFNLCPAWHMRTSRDEARRKERFNLCPAWHRRTTRLMV